MKRVTMDGESKNVKNKKIKPPQNPEMDPGGDNGMTARKRKRGEAEEDVDGRMARRSQSFQSFLIVMLHSQER